MTPTIGTQLRGLLGVVRDQIATGDIVAAGTTIREAEGLCRAALLEPLAAARQDFSGLEQLLAECVQDGQRARAVFEQQLASTGTHLRAQVAYRRRRPPR